jgi:hypothetical protein
MEILQHFCAGGEEDITSSLQERAVAAGGFSAPAASLGLEELGVGTPAGWLHRGLLLQVCLAFAVNASTRQQGLQVPRMLSCACHLRHTACLQLCNLSLL